MHEKWLFDLNNLPEGPAWPCPQNTIIRDILEYSPDLKMIHPGWDDDQPNRTSTSINQQLLYYLYKLNIGKTHWGILIMKQVFILGITFMIIFLGFPGTCTAIEETSTISLLVSNNLSTGDTYQENPGQASTITTDDVLATNTNEAGFPPLEWMIVYVLAILVLFTIVSLVIVGKYEGWWGKRPPD